jgi:hypothetical protein
MLPCLLLCVPRLVKSRVQGVPAVVHCLAVVSAAALSCVAGFEVRASAFGLNPECRVIMSHQVVAERVKGMHAASVLPKMLRCPHPSWQRVLAAATAGASAADTPLVRRLQEIVAVASFVRLFCMTIASVWCRVWTWP